MRSDRDGADAVVTPRFAAESTATSAMLVGLVAMMAISTDLYLPSLPAIARDLRVDVAAAQLTLSAFLIGIAGGQLVLGPLSDRFGRRPVLIGATLCYTLASIACAFATDIDRLVAARVMQAIGACAGGVVGRAVVRDGYGRERAARVLALIGSAMSVVPAIGPIVGGFVETYAGWRWNFALLTGFGSMLFVAILVGLPETNRYKDAKATQPARLLVNFIAIARTRSFLAYALAGAASYAGMFAFISGSSFVFVDVLHTTPRAFGFYFALAVFGYFLGTQVTARLTMRLGIDAMLRLSGLVMLAGGGAMVLMTLAGLTRSETWGAPPIAIAMAVYCIGFGICSPSAMAGAIGPFPQMAGTASAVMGFMQTGLAALRQPARTSESKLSQSQRKVALGDSRGGVVSRKDTA